MRQTETMVAQVPHKQFNEKELASEITGIEVKAEALVIETDETVFESYRQNYTLPGGGEAALPPLEG